jgi:hypothetical protein
MRSKFLNEPAVLVGVVEAFLAVLVTFQLPGLDANDAGLILAAVSAGLGAVAAWATRDTFLSLLAGFGKAVLILAINYGAPISEETMGSLVALMAVVVGAYVRTQTSPVIEGNFKVPDNPNVGLPKAA